LTQDRDFSPIYIGYVFGLPLRNAQQHKKKVGFCFEEIKGFIFPSILGIFLCVLFLNSPWREALKIATTNTYKYKKIKK
jgi:hypothetical protein